MWVHPEDIEKFSAEYEFTKVGKVHAVRVADYPLSMEVLGRRNSYDEVIDELERKAAALNPAGGVFIISKEETIKDADGKHHLILEATVYSASPKDQV